MRAFSGFGARTLAYGAVDVVQRSGSGSRSHRRVRHQPYWRAAQRVRALSKHR